jgi:hypothetical protein
MSRADQALVLDGERSYGRLPERPLQLNPLDQWSGGLRRLKRMRLKEWIYFTLLHPDLFTAMAIQDANYVSSSEIYACLRSDNRVHEHARNGLGGTLHMPERLYPSRCRFAARNYELLYEFGPAEGEHRIEIAIAAARHGAALRASLVLYGDRASAPLSVSSRIPGGAIFTHKRAFPVSGTYAVGDMTVRFDPDRDLALIDEHKSFLPYRTRWTWGTFATVADGTILGANLIERPELAGADQEGGVWIDAGIEPLDDITFTDAGDHWQVRSADASAELIFTPAGAKQVNHQLLVAAIDYRQIFGTYSGTLRGRGVDNVRGVVETMNARL